MNKIYGEMWLVYKLNQNISYICQHKPHKRVHKICALHINQTKYYARALDKKQIWKDSTKIKTLKNTVKYVPHVEAYLIWSFDDATR